MGNLSRHFNRSEIECNCGCGLNTMDIETLKVADIARDYVGHSITPSSGARCFEYNRSDEVGSNDNSQHPRCRAMDLPCDDPEALFDYLNDLYPDQYGFGLYNTFVHIDTKSGRARRWDLR